jgi:hypothetical protein
VVLTGALVQHDRRLFSGKHRLCQFLKGHVLQWGQPEHHQQSLLYICMALPKPHTVCDSLSTEMSCLKLTGTVPALLC